MVLQYIRVHYYNISQCALTLDIYVKYTKILEVNLFGQMQTN